MGKGGGKGGELEGEWGGDARGEGWVYSFSGYIANGPLATY